MFHLKRNLGKGLIFGLATFLLPMIAGVAATRLVFGSSWSTCLLISTMYSSHTLISYPTISRFGLQNSAQ